MTADFQRDCPETYRQLVEALAGRAVHHLYMEQLQDDVGPFIRITASCTDGVLRLDSREPWRRETVH